MGTKQKHIEQYKLLHEIQSGYGSSSIEFMDEISLMINFLQPKTVFLDYGCGKGVLLEALKKTYPQIDFFGYDPAIKGKEVLLLKTADMVINTDVLEHIPEEVLPSVIQEISEISQNVYFNLHHALAMAILPNGENAHCTVKPPDWYHKMFKNYFEVVQPLAGRRECLSVVVTFELPDEIVGNYYSILFQGS